MISAYGNKNNLSVNTSNSKLFEETRDFYLAGLFITAGILLLMCISFGKDKDVFQKIASLILLGGGLFLGGFFTYLLESDGFKDLTSSEDLISTIASVFYIVFVLAYIAFILFEEVHGEIGKNVRLIYSIILFLSFIIIGLAVVRFNFDLIIPKGEKESFLVPLSTGFFILGVTMLLFAIISQFPEINRGLGFTTGGLGFTTGGLGFTTGGLGFSTGVLGFSTGEAKIPSLRALLTTVSLFCDILFLIY